jgi:hypothetical protein
MLPDRLQSEFRRQANNLSHITPDNIATILNQTIAPQIKEILEDPILQASRASNFRDESWKVSFANTKGRSAGLTVTELERLMNSAFLYLPYISRNEVRVEGRHIHATVSGGIIWYQVVVKPTGETDIVLIKSIQTTGRGYARYIPQGEANFWENYTRFSWGTRSYPVSEIEYAQYEAIAVFARNLSIKTKEIEAFNVSAYISESRGRGIYGALVGKREGLHLDDGFFIIENVETRSGEIKSRRAGFVRLVKNADNWDNPTAVSLFKQYTGKQAHEGMILREHPRLGVDIGIKVGQQSDMTIPQDIGNDKIFTSDIDSQILVGFDVSYNLAPILGITQAFAEVEFLYGVPFADFHDLGNGMIYTYSGYAGLSKKWWVRRNGLRLSAMVGYEVLTITGDIAGSDYFYSYDGIATKVGLSYNLMLTPDFLFNTGVDFKTFHEIHGYPRLDLGGKTFSVGFSYSFGELGDRLFSHLDALKTK